MKALLTGIIILAAIEVSLGQSFELLGVEYATYPSAAVNEIDSVASSFTELEVSANYPVFRKEKWMLLAGVTCRLVIPESEDRLVNDNLLFIGLQLSGIFNISDNKKLIFTALPALSTTDELGQLSGNNFLMQGGALFRKQVSERFSYTLGIVSTSRFGFPLLMPSVGLSHAGDKMKLDVNLPFLAQTMWNYQNSFSYGVKLSVNGSQYNFNNESFNGTEVKLAQFSRLRLGPEIQYRIKGPFVLTLFGGITVNRNYVFELEGGDTLDFGLENGPFLAAKISLKPK